MVFDTTQIALGFGLSIDDESLNALCLDQNSDHSEMGFMRLSLRFDDPDQPISYQCDLVPFDSPCPRVWDYLTRIDSDLLQPVKLIMWGLPIDQPILESGTISIQPPWVHALAILTLMGWNPSKRRVLYKTGYQFVLLERTSKPRCRLGPVMDSDGPDALLLFEKVFGHGMSPLLWDWKYGDDRSRSLLARSENGQLVAHYGATVRPLTIFGQIRGGLQVCDVMVDPSERGILTKGGVFFKVACAFQESYFGYSRQFDLAFGFPNARAMKVAERLHLYQSVDRLLEMSWSPSKSARSQLLRVYEVSSSDLSDAHLNRIWRRMSDDLNDFIAVVRDASYVRFRYFDHPTVDYKMLLVRHRITQRAYGLVFLRFESDHVKLMDVIARLKDIPSMIECARYYVHDHGAQSIKAWLTAKQSVFFKGSEASLNETDIHIPTHSWTAGIPLSTIEGRWWSSMGDTDFL